MCARGTDEQRGSWQDRSRHRPWRGQARSRRPERPVRFRGRHRSASALSLHVGLLAGAFVLAFSGPASAGAWLFEPGDGVVIATAAFTGSANAYDENGRLQPISDYRKFELRAHIEYGVTPWLTGVFKTDGRLETQDGQDTTTGVTGLGARARLAKTDRAVISAQLVGYTPGLDTNAVWLQSEPAALDARILFGRSFMLFGQPAFIDAQGGYRATASGGSDEVHLDLTLGLKPSPRWLLMAQTFSTISINASEPYRYHKVQASALYRLAHGFGIQLGATGTIGGISALQERGVFSALWYEF